MESFKTRLDIRRRRVHASENFVQASTGRGANTRVCQAAILVRGFLHRMAR